MEHFTSLLADQQIKRSAHRSARELAATARAYIDVRDADPKSFRWIKTSEDILVSTACFSLGTLAIEKQYAWGLGNRDASRPRDITTRFFGNGTRQESSLQIGDKRMSQIQISERRTTTDERLRLYGGTPTLYGVPLAQRPEDLRGADVAFLGIPWQAPSPERWLGGIMPNYDTQLTPSTFRQNSLLHRGYLPEMDLDVFEHIRLVDYGDADVVHDMKQTLTNVETRVKEIIDAGCIPITIGGNAGPSTYPVLKAVAERAGGSTAVLNFDAHHDNQRGEWEQDDPRQPRWGSTWSRRILNLPGVDPANYYHVGLRGPINDRETFARFTERGVKREHIYTSRDLKQARRSGFEEWAEALAEKVASGADKVWIGVDPDVLDIGSNPDFAIDPFGPTADEIIELVYRVGLSTGRKRFGGLAFMALPYSARAVHFICLYILLYSLAGVVAHAKQE